MTFNRKPFLAGIMAAALGPMQMADHARLFGYSLPGEEPQGRAPKFRHRPDVREISEKRRDFTAAYKANPCNRLPGRVLVKLYKRAKTQPELERLATKWFEDESFRRKMA